jgi:hypothetical protein
MVQNSEKMGVYDVLWHLGNWTQKSTKGPQVGGMCVPMSKLEKKAPNQINRPILVREMVQNNQKRLFMHFWGIWAPPNGPKMVLKDLQVGRLFVPMS